MNGNGFTGFNPDEMRHQIKKFKDYGEDVVYSIITALTTFHSQIKTAWYSPKAVEFGKKMEELVEFRVQGLEKGYYNITASATKIYNIHANANNWPQMESPTQSSVHFMDKVNAYYSLEGKSPQGVVGMNKFVVETALSKLTVSMKECVDKLYKTPYDIAIYDESGAQAESYRAEIQALTSKFRESFDELMVEIKNAINTEIQTIKIASTNATNTFTM